MSRVAFLFPGQGAQRAGMGKDFYEVSAVARKVIDEAGEWLGLDLKKLCFEEDERLNQTEYTQAALLTVCLAMEKTLETYGIFPEVTAGLSLGEYCAIETAGALSLKDAVLTVRKRGLLMEEAVPAGVGAMAGSSRDGCSSNSGCDSKQRRRLDCQRQLPGAAGHYRRENGGGGGWYPFKGSRSQEGPALKGQRTVSFTFVEHSRGKAGGGFGTL